MAVSPVALVWPGLYLGLLIATSAASALSLRSGDGLWAGPALGAMHLAWGLGFMQRVIERGRAKPAPRMRTG
jgi:succinoglycan biosynthesis protein ExoA